MKKKPLTSIQARLSTLPQTVVRSNYQKADNYLNFPLNHYSQSSWTKFSTNPLMFKVNNMNGDYFNVASNVGGVLGSAVHKALEVYFGGNPDIPTSAKESEAIKEGYEHGLQYLKDYNDAFIEWSEKIKNRESLYERFSFCYFGIIKEGVYKEAKDHLLLVEKELLYTVEVDGKILPIPLKGKPDLVYRDKQKRIIVKDHKTTYMFSNPDKIDAAKLIQAVFYFFLVYAEFGEPPYAIEFSEMKYTENSGDNKGKSQLKTFTMVYEEIALAFELFYRFYEDITDALLGKQVFVPNFNALFDNEVSIVAYANRLDVDEIRDKEFKKMKVDNITDFMKKKIQKAGNMKKYLETVQKQFISGESLDYKNMKTEEQIRMKLAEHGIALDFDSKIKGATVTLYCYEPSIGLKMSKIEKYVKDIEQVVKRQGVRILAPIPNTGLVGFEVPNEKRTFPKLPDPSKGFDIAIGQTIMGQVRRFDLRDAPHLLVAGSSGTGKSVFLGNTITQLLAVPNVRLYLFDPKQVELAEYEDNAKVVKYESEPGKIRAVLGDLIEEMEKRYTMMKADKIKSIAGTRKFPYLVVVIDEYADLAMNGGIDDPIKRLAQKGRAAGIHLIIATQRASTRVIDGDIKINFPVRMIFKMAKDVDSRVMLDQGGAEKLLGKGDALFLADQGLERLQAYND